MLLRPRVQRLVDEALDELLRLVGEGACRMKICSDGRKTRLRHGPGGQRRAIGPMGTVARMLVGCLIVGDVVYGHVMGTFRPTPWILGLVGFPGLILAVQAMRARRDPRPLDATGPLAQVLNIVAFVALYLTPATSDAALVFYGASMLLAAARGYAGCEVLAVSNWLLRRHDEVGCLLFAPVDDLERRDRSLLKREV